MPTRFGNISLVGVFFRCASIVSLTTLSVSERVEFLISFLTSGCGFLIVGYSKLSQSELIHKLVQKSRLKF